MESLYLIVFFGLSLLFSALWMKEKYGEDTRATVKNVYKQLSSIEEKLAVMASDQSSRQDNQAPDGPVTRELVREALRYHHLPLDESDPEEPDIVNFSYDGVHYRINTRSLPYLSMEAGFSFKIEKEDIDLMKQVAQEITYGMFVAKVYASEKGFYVFQADLLADSYLTFRDNLRRYIDILIDAQRRFAESYHQKRQEQKQVSEEALHTTLLAGQTDATGNKILS